MTNNDCLRRLRYIFDFGDAKMISIFALADYETSREQVSALLKRDDDLDCEACSDQMLALFLNGLINAKRGKREGEQPVAETVLSNNIIFMKLKIALNLKAEDIIAILEMADVYISKHELSAFFRKVGHKHYRKCKDQILRNFLKGLQLQYRDEGDEDEVEEYQEQAAKAEKKSITAFKWKQV